MGIRETGTPYVLTTHFIVWQSFEVEIMNLYFIDEASEAQKS